MSSSVKQYNITRAQIVKLRLALAKLRKEAASGEKHGRRFHPDLWKVQERALLAQLDDLIGQLAKLKGQAKEELDDED